VSSRRRLVPVTPRVEVLTYEIRWLNPAVRVLPAGQHVVLGEFDCTIDMATLTARPTSLFRTEEEAQGMFEPHLRAWELEIELETGYRIEFRLSSSHAVDGPAEPVGPTHHVVGLNDYLSMTDSLQVIVQSALPGPTGTYRVSPRVQVWLARLRDVRDGREKAPTGAYAVLTDLEQTFGSGSRTRAAAALNMSGHLLDKVAQLASGNHPLHGRKVTTTGPPLTDADLAWLTRAVVVLVRRAAAIESGATGLPQVTVADV
jgi:hypothetical protein